MKFSLSEKYPKLAKQWDYDGNYPLIPTDLFAKDNKNYSWKCDKCGHIWIQRIDHRMNGYGKCIVCNSVAVKHAFIMNEWDYEKNKKDPKLVNFHSIEKFWWKCKKGHSWICSADGRVRGGKAIGCPYCSNPPKKICYENSLACKNPKLAKEWDNKKNGKLKPEDVFENSKKKIWWKCKKGHSWMSNINNRSYGNGCPYCDGIVLYNGVYLDSLVEAYMYIKYQEQNLDFKYHGFYGGELGKKRYDFYFPKSKTYIEVSSYKEDYKFWKAYYAKILEKKKYVEDVLKGKFQFIQLELTKKQRDFVKQHEKGVRYYV